MSFTYDEVPLTIPMPLSSNWLSQPVSSAMPRSTVPSITPLPESTGNLGFFGDESVVISSLSGSSHCVSCTADEDQLKTPVPLL